MNKKQISWEQIDEYCENISIILKEPNYKHLKFITGIPRGGLIPSVILSHKTELVYINWDKLNQYRQYHIDYHNLLAVDEICDSGKTFIDLIGDKINSPFNNITTCSLIKRYSSKYTPDIVAYIEESNDWLEFAWEK